MKMKMIFFCFLIPIVASQTSPTTQEVLATLPELFVQVENFKFLENYNEYAPNTTSGAMRYGKGNYDIIIIGAGSAGTVLANRLSQISSWKVLLLEAGQNETLYTDIPQLVGALQFSKKNWGYLSTPQKSCCQGMVDKRCYVIRGKGLGGSSSINYMMYVRGNKKDFDDICRADNPGWCYDDVLPYFKEVEHSTLSGNVDPPYHGTKGTLNVEFIRNYCPLGEAFIDANVERGSKVLDYNGRNQMGVSRLQSTTINGRRCSANKAFLTPVIHRKNLEVVTGAFVTKINIQTRNMRKPKAKSVEFLLEGKKYFVDGRLEIILSAGAVASPQILMHSGVGPKDDLGSLKIPVVKNLPVGQSLHDHLMVVSPFMNNYTDATFKRMDLMIPDYLNGFGYLTAAGNIQSLGFNNTDDENRALPNTEHFMSAFFDLNGESLKKSYNWDNDTYNDLMAGYRNNCGLFHQILLHPKSRGSIKLQSNNVLDLPLIDFNYFSNPDDLKSMIKAINLLHSLTETKAMQRFNVSIPRNVLRSCSQHAYASDEYWKCYFRHSASSIFHLSGTCKMGPVTDSEAVVCPRLKVKGIDNLRVVDASILPKPISGHTNAAVIMIGAKAADIIKQDHGLSIQHYNIEMRKTLLLYHSFFIHVAVNKDTNIPTLAKI